ncbi:MAG: hypothetical protein WCH75_08835 [Candidatus Binatia bacterium]
MIAVEIVRPLLRLWTIGRQQSGFTLNEILVAMNIIVIAILGYSLNTVAVIRGNFANQNTTIAINLAQDKMEQLKAQEALVDEDRCPSSGDQGIGATGVANGIFDRCWKIFDAPLGTHLKQIDVKVSWREHQDREVIVTTLIYTE